MDTTDGIKILMPSGEGIFFLKASSIHSFYVFSQSL